MSTACDHRRLQRTLFRMQADAGFARAILNGDAAATASTGLTAPDLALLRDLDLAGVTADPGDKRRMQLLGNLTSEFRLTLAAAAREDLRGFPSSFLTSPEFHRAIAAAERLPHAFADYAQRAGEGRAAHAAILALDTAMMLHRREPERNGATGVGVALAPRARLLELPNGTLADATELRAALDQGHDAPACASHPPGTEVLLLFAAGQTSPFRLPEIHVERLESPADMLFERLAVGPMDAAERARFSGEHGAQLDELEAFIDGLVADGFLVREA